MAAPDSSHTARAYLDALQHQLVCHADWPVGRMLEAVFENGFFNCFINSIGMWSSGARKPVDETFRSESLIVASDLVELLAGVAHDFAGFADVGQIGS